MRAFHAPCTVPLMTFQTQVVGISSGYKFTWEGSNVFNFRDLTVKMFAVAMLLSLLALTCATAGGGGVAPSLHRARRPSSTRGLRISSCTAAPWGAPAFLGSSLEVAGARAQIFIWRWQFLFHLGRFPFARGWVTEHHANETQSCLPSWLQYALCMFVFVFKMGVATPVSLVPELGRQCTPDARNHLCLPSFSGACPATAVHCRAVHQLKVYELPLCFVFVSIKGLVGCV